VLAIDESSKADAVHLFRVSLPYRGGSPPLAWAVWQQNQPLPDGQHWATVDAVLAQVARLLPPGVEVVVVADRAYEIPAFVDRLAAYGWRWVVRCKVNASTRWRDRQGREQAVRDLARRQLSGPGRRWKGRGWVFKGAGWRQASLVAVWGAGHKEPLALLTDLPAQWAVLRLYQRRFWIEPGFRNDKTRGWQWEASQVRGLAHHERRLLALAWACLVMLCLGAQEAEARLAARLARRGRRHRPRRAPDHARESLFTLGLRRARQWLYRPQTVALRWHLPAILEVSWTEQWQRTHALFPRLQTVRP
jgi:hypothetical protein